MKPFSLLFSLLLVAVCIVCLRAAGDSYDDSDDSGPKITHKHTHRVKTSPSGSLTDESIAEQRPGSGEKFSSIRLNFMLHSRDERTEKNSESVVSFKLTEEDGESYVRHMKAQPSGVSGIDQSSTSGNSDDTSPRVQTERADSTVSQLDLYSASFLDGLLRMKSPSIEIYHNIPYYYGARGAINIKLKREAIRYLLFISGVKTEKRLTNLQSQSGGGSSLFRKGDAAEATDGDGTEHPESEESPGPAYNIDRPSAIRFVDSLKMVVKNEFPGVSDFSANICDAFEEFFSRIWEYADADVVTIRLKLDSCDGFLVQDGITNFVPHNSKAYLKLTFVCLVGGAVFGCIVTALYPRSKSPDLSVITGESLGTEEGLWTEGNLGEGKSMSRLITSAVSAGSDGIDLVEPSPDITSAATTAGSIALTMASVAISLLLLF